MIKTILVVITGFFTGIIIGYIIFFYTPILPSKFTHTSPIQILIPQKQINAFLPYWLLSKAKKDYSPYINRLTYFGLTIDADGKILKMQNEQEEEPGWSALKRGLFDPFLNAAKKKNITLSLLIFAGDPDSIKALASDPQVHAKNLVQEVVPIMKKYGFKDLNLDIEDVTPANDEQRLQMTQFIKEVKKGLESSHGGTLTLEISASDLIQKRILYPRAIEPYADFIIIMAYDYHYIGSFVTGPVAPISGVETVAEFDIDTALQKAIAILPEEKIILGVPLYGYQWETLGTMPRAAVIPGTGLTSSNMRAEQFLKECSTCSAQWDSEAAEKYVIYEDQETGTYHQLYIPDEKAVAAKINLVKQWHLGGVALWAAGYEGDKILEPLREYK